MTRRADDASVPLGADVPGALMEAEINEQPAALERLVRDGGREIDAVAAFVAARRPRFVLFAGRGTSGNAAIYGQYLTEIELGLPVGLTAPSTVTAYGARPDLRDVLLVAVSQSGGSPDLVESVEVGRAAGATTVVLTNDLASPLAAAAELVVDLESGPERAVAATKTYTSELLALHLLLRGLGGGDVSAAGGIGEWAAVALGETLAVDRAVQTLLGTERVVTTGRGYSFPAACETALKLAETSYLSAQAFSGAELLHGPIAMLDAGEPVIAVAPPGVAGRVMAPVLETFRDIGVALVTVGSPEPGAGDAVNVPLPSGVPEELSPIVEIVPLQLVALRLSLALGYNPDRPRRLHKVTATL